MNGNLRWIAAGLLLAGCNGPEQVFIDLVPIMTVTPDVLDLGEEGVLYTKTGEIYVTNDGLKDLEVTPTLEAPGVFSIDVVDTFIVPKGETQTITVSFSPETFKEYQGKVRFESDDKEHPLWVVPITGVGIQKPTPDIEVEPRTVEINLPQGTFSDYLYFDIKNVGDADLVLQFPEMEGDTDEFKAIVTPAPGTVVAPGQSTQVIVEYATSTTDGHNATLHIPSNDPDEPDMTVLLLGNGGGDYDKPEAIIDCPASVGLAGPEYVRLSGAQSTDPAGAWPLTYKWDVTQRPAGSDDKKIDPDDQPEADVYVDVAGTYEVSLVVTNALGTQSEPTYCSFLAAPEDDIHVELSWNTAQADMDLHLTQGGALMFDVPEDCNYCNMFPDWGTNSNDDDPRLDIDDRGGYGPENINIYLPQNGTYDIRVHYFSDGGDDTVIATVNVWLDGALVYSGNQAMEKDDVWFVGTINWPDNLTDLIYPPPEEVLTRASVRTCQRD